MDIGSVDVPRPVLAFDSIFESLPSLHPPPSSWVLAIPTGTAQRVGVGLCSPVAGSPIATGTCGITCFGMDRGS